MRYSWSCFGNILPFYNIFSLSYFIPVLVLLDPMENYKNISYDCLCYTTRSVRSVMRFLQFSTLGVSSGYSVDVTLIIRVYFTYLFI